MDTNKHPHRYAGLRHLSWLCIVVVFLGALGCNRDSGPARYDLTGTITYDGKPVPAGYILFAPDTYQGNDGPGASASIKDGVYRVRSGEGTVGGPHSATINGFDDVSFQQGLTSNPMGKPLFLNVEIAVDVPKQDATHDFAIPAQKK